MGMENLKMSTRFSMSLLLTSLPSLVTGFHSTSSFFLSGLLPPFLLSPPRPKPLSLGGPWVWAAGWAGWAGWGCSAITLYYQFKMIKKQKNNIQVEMAVKKLAFNIFSAIFAVAIVLINWTSVCVLRLLKRVQHNSQLARNIAGKWLRVADSGKREILEYLQIIVNLIAGVLLADSLLGYHSFFVETIVTITYQLHLLSLNWAVDLPDYSTYLKDSQAVKIITTLFYLLFGCIGLSTQICFTLDLISILSYPFRALRRFCEWACGELIRLKDIMISILTIKRKYWVTCPYPEYLLNDTFKIVYICALPLVFYLIFLTKIYSLFMAALIFIFKTIINLGANLSFFLEEIGRITITLAGVDIEEDSLCFNSKTLRDRLQSVGSKLGNLEWISVFKWKKVKDMFLGTEAQSLSFQEPLQVGFVSIISVYEQFSHYLQ